ncbi:hypothetical protein Clacol_003841 [Clathrus columnatus]|uniref:WD40 repeat-like protein n=1 Tax=Clathrus columnatus TaxID=1419009 RepID=A0AAV5A826_9AGAM|nr:hypothetical protein Clacol_003841 [Clathrus columnatus]
MRISADEINCLIYAYLQDSGFEHSSYALRNEARLDFSQHANTPLRRGELVDLLSKALLYTEVETHWNMGQNLNCNAPFSLVLPHKCSFNTTDPETNKTPSPYQSTRPELFSYTNGTTYNTTSTAQKRKASSAPSEDSRAEKKICVNEDVALSTEKITEKDETKKVILNDEEPGVIDVVNDKLGVSNRVEDTEHLTHTTSQNDSSSSPVVLLHGHGAEVPWNPVYSDLLATGSKDATTRIWSWQNIKLKLQNNTNNLNPQFQTVYPDSLLLSHTKEFDQPDITSLDWSPDGNLLATGSSDSALRIWNRDGNAYMIQTRHSGSIVSVQFSPNGNFLLSAGLDGIVCVWNVISRILHVEFHIESKCLDIDWLDDSTFVTCSSSQNIQMVSIYPDDAFRTIVRSDQTLRTFVGHTGEINQVKFNEDRSLLASCSDDTTARIWTSETWTDANGSVITIPDPSTTYEAKVILVGHTNSVGAIQWCPSKDADSRTILATCSFDGTARLWDALNGSCLRIFSDSSQPLFSITFDPTGRYLATGSEDGYLYVYDKTTGKTAWRWPTSGPGVGPIYDVNWQKIGGSHLAMCLKSKLVAVVDTKAIPEFSNNYHITIDV